MTHTGFRPADRRSETYVLKEEKDMKKTVAWILILALALCLGAAGAEGLYAAAQQVSDSPDWVKALPSAQDENVKQLFVVAA